MQELIQEQAGALRCQHLKIAPAAAAAAAAVEAAVAPDQALAAAMKRSYSTISASF
jgi:hypothetical protein